MSKGIKKRDVWKHCKTNTLWVVLYRNGRIVNLMGISKSVEGEIRQVKVNNVLKKYKFDKVYKTLHGKFDRHPWLNNNY